jgi:hypothetical protein
MEVCRVIFGTKLSELSRRGPGGWWRIAKNAARYLLRIHERPLPAATWTAMAQRHGFCDVSVAPVVNEAAVLVARCP